MRSAVRLLLLCCVLVRAPSSAAGGREPCAVDAAGTGGTCLTIAACPDLLQLAQTATLGSPAVVELQKLLKKCPPSPAGGLKICCKNEEASRQAQPAEISENSAGSATDISPEPAAVTGPDTELRVSTPPADPRDLLPPEEECGRQLIARIIGGRSATIGELPWMASIQYTRSPDAPLEHGCGGTLITSRHVLTAAHCVSFLSDPDVSPRSVLLGELDFSSERDCLEDDPNMCSDPPISVDIDTIFSHPEFQRVGLPHDIAVIRLAQEVRFTDFIRPICLLTDLSVLRAGRTDLTPGLRGMVAGWGRSEVRGVEQFTPVLQTARVPIKAMEECERQFSAGRRLRLGGRICAGAGPEGTDTCRGDSGGPLMLPLKFGVVWYQIGVSSFGTAACGAVAGYTRVFQYKDWILEQLSKT